MYSAPFCPIRAPQPDAQPLAWWHTCTASRRRTALGATWEALPCTWAGTPPAAGCTGNQRPGQGLKYTHQGWEQNAKCARSQSAEAEAPTSASQSGVTKNARLPSTGTSAHEMRAAGKQHRVHLYRGRPEVVITLCSQEASTPLVQRCSRSPPCTSKAPGMGSTACHLPAQSMDQVNPGAPTQQDNSLPCMLIWRPGESAVSREPASALQLQTLEV